MKKSLALGISLVVGIELLALIVQDRLFVLAAAGVGMALVLLNIRRVLGHPNDPAAHKRFRLAYCAYHCLTDGTMCRELMYDTKQSVDAPRDGKYDLSTPWGFYLWWRERFFE